MPPPQHIQHTFTPYEDSRPAPAGNGKAARKRAAFSCSLEYAPRSLQPRTLGSIGCGKPYGFTIRRISKNSETNPTTENPRTSTSSRVSTSPFRRSFSVMMLWAPPDYRLRTRRAGMRESAGDLTTPHDAMRANEPIPSNRLMRCTYAGHATSLSIIAACRHVNQTTGPPVRFRIRAWSTTTAARRVRSQRQHGMQTLCL